MATDSKVKIKLLIDISGKKVLFAEAGKDFVDFLFYILSLPVGTVVNLLKKRSMVGCLGTLYQSIENLNETYIQPNQKKDVVLNPRTTLCSSEIPLKLNYNQSDARKFYKCRSSCSVHHGNQYLTCISDVPNVPCPQCTQVMATEMYYVAPTTTGKDGAAQGEGGFVKGVVTYMVMDDLEVKPMSTISSITMLNKFNVTDVGSLQEKVVEVGIDEGLKLLKASLQIKAVLTSVFLRNVGA